MNFPAVDLGCRTSRISIQVTSDHSSSKVSETLRKFKAHNLHNDFDKLYVYVLTEKQHSYNSKELTDAVSNSLISFDVSKDIIDYRDLAKRLGDISTEKLEVVSDYLEREFIKSDKALKFRVNLDAFLDVSRQKIEEEKRTKKYIPSIFVETSDVKDEMRYFANPMFFYRKIDEEFMRIDGEDINKILRMAKITPIEIGEAGKQCLAAPNDLVELQEHFIQQSAKIEALKTIISPFSWYYKKEERFVPSDYLTGYWDVFRYSIQSIGSGMVNSLENLLEKIKIAQAKIFLITGMAGQGKTNFICDLIENQYRVFEIPTIFIPARSLNNFSGHNRILSYIINNRYSPKFDNIHELFYLLSEVAIECKKPFIIAIDGINEVGDLNEFVAELRVMFDALCQYEFIKVVITCRNEFFEQKFSDVFTGNITEHLYRVKDLRKEMSVCNKSRLLDAYIHHFRIKAVFSNSSSEFLKNDLLLLRIFCEINEGNDIGHVSDIYKGNVFESYLIMKIKDFPIHLQQKVLKTIYKICARMLEIEDFSHISLDGFEYDKLIIIERLIGEDIILRREVPTTGLASVGIENISFTYDELRDFLLAYYIVLELGKTDAEKVSEIMEKISGWSIYEGFFRYIYILSRKHSCNTIQIMCEEFNDFNSHYLNNLSLLSADIQTEEDVRRLNAILSNSSDENELRQIAWFLFRKRNDSELLNITILTKYLNKLKDSELGQFMKAMFSYSLGYGHASLNQSVSTLLMQFINLNDNLKFGLGAPSLSLLLYFVPYSNWTEEEKVLSFFSRFGHVKEVIEAKKICGSSMSMKVQKILKEIIEEGVK